jgi:probable biosynthetic protein (TIGR04099 family)
LNACINQDGCTKAFQYTPCPYSDFNGAGFLYFANFQKIVDRAEWSELDDQQLWSTTQREIEYFSNINVGERLVLEVNKKEMSNDFLSQWYTIRKASDGKRIADITTKKLAVTANSYVKDYLAMQGG